MLTPWHTTCRSTSTRATGLSIRALAASLRWPKHYYPVLRKFPARYGVSMDVHTREHPPPHIHLFLPLNKERGRFEWPSFKPLRPTRRLSGKEGKEVRKYLDDFAEEINAKLQRTYSSLR
jgi:hypothetical protein